MAELNDKLGKVLKDCGLRWNDSPAGKGKRRQSHGVRFWQKVNIGEEDACWPWMAGTRNGYGHFAYDYKSEYAHRYAFRLYGGRLPKGRAAHIMHRCNNKLCCNPRHLRVGTAQENTIDAYKDGLAMAGMRHPRTKIPSAIIEKIRNDPRPQLKLKEIYGVSQAHISRIKRGEIRKYEAQNGAKT